RPQRAEIGPRACQCGGGAKPGRGCGGGGESCPGRGGGRRPPAPPRRPPPGPPRARGGELVLLSPPPRRRGGRHGTTAPALCFAGRLGGDRIPLVRGRALNDTRGDYAGADKGGTRRAFQIFLAQYPTGYYADLAREALGKLRPPAPPASDDATAWEKIKDTADQAALRNFIKRFPDSPLATNAEHRLQVLADGEVMRAWEMVDKDNAAAIHKFMKAFPASTLAAGTGKARLNELDQQVKDRDAKKQAEIAAAKKVEAEREAAQAWQKIKSTSDRNAVLDFINR